MEDGKRTCRHCQQTKKFVDSGKRYQSNGSRVMIDENGKRWYGWRCPQCHQADVKSRAAAKKAAKPIGAVAP